jgi:hypothetical protein
MTKKCRDGWEGERQGGRRGRQGGQRIGGRAGRKGQGNGGKKEDNRRKAM